MPGTDPFTPLQVSGLTGVAAVAPGLALKADGTMWAWGGRSGDGTTTIRIAPRRIGGLTDVFSVAASSIGGLALNNDLTAVWQWYGSLAPSPVSGLSGVLGTAAGSVQNLALKADGTVWAWSGQSPPFPVSGLSQVANFAVGDFRSLAAKEDGTVWEWDGQSAPIRLNGLDGVVAVAVAFEWWWGDDPVDTCSLALKSDGTVWVWTEGEWRPSPTPVQVRGLDGIIAIAGGATSLALKADGTVWEWDESALVRPEPVQVSGLSGVVAVAVGAPGNWGTLAPHRLALKDDGTVWAWGSNGFGQLGDGTTTSREIPVQVAGLSRVRGIATAGYHSFAVKDDGTVWGCGENGNGELGDGTAGSTPVQVIQPGSPDLAIAIRHDGDFTVGGQGVYTLTISNTGLTPTSGAVTVTDTLPAGLTYVSGMGDGWTCFVADQIVTCTNPGPIRPAASSTIALTVRVEPRAWPGVTNLATVANASDRNIANNTIGDPTVVLPRPL